jgi:hypothetical protein
MPGDAGLEIPGPRAGSPDWRQTIDLAATSRELTPQKFPFPPKLSQPRGKEGWRATLTHYSENKLIKFGALFTLPSRTKSYSFTAVPTFWNAAPMYSQLLVTAFVEFRSPSTRHSKTMRDIFLPLRTNPRWMSPLLGGSHPLWGNATAPELSFLNVWTVVLDRQSSPRNMTALNAY